MTETHLHVLEKVRRAPTMSLEDEDDFGDNEEFFPSATATPGLDEDHVKTQFDQDIADAKLLSQRKFADDTERNKNRMKFVVSRETDWQKTTWEGRNFLHYLAYYDYNRKPFISLQWLMARAIFRLPHLMGAMDKSKRTPLTVALSLGNEMFCHAACKNQKAETLQKFGPALLSECEDHDNDREITCLHTALICPFVKEESRADIVKIMCGFVPEKMFTITDIKHRTPLHLAVEYDRCCKTQVGIVTELLRRGLKALEVEMSTYTHRTMSVYQYHEATRKQAEAKKKQAENREGKNAQTNPRDDVENRPRLDESKDNPKKAGVRVEKGVMGPPPTRDRERGEPMPPGIGIKRRDSSQVPTTPHEGEAPTLSLDRRPAGSIAGDKPRLGTAQAALLDSLRQREEEREQAAKVIGEQLKLLYLRTQRPDRVSHCLQVQDERGMYQYAWVSQVFGHILTRRLAKELWFDFGPAKKLTKADFQKHFGHLRFDSALQYVAFPQVELNEGDDDPDIRYQGRKVRPMHDPDGLRYLAS